MLEHYADIGIIEVYPYDSKNTCRLPLEIHLGVSGRKPLPLPVGYLSDVIPRTIDPSEEKLRDESYCIPSPMEENAVGIECRLAPPSRGSQQRHMGITR